MPCDCIHNQGGWRVTRAEHSGGAGQARRQEGTTKPSSISDSPIRALRTICTLVALT
jgi:hypothetical protein